VSPDETLSSVEAGPPKDPGLFDDLSWRGLVHQCTAPTLPTLLAEQRFTLYIGFDPTADSLHVGSLQQLCLLRRAQEAGHRPIALVGGGTGMIGDPSGKSEERELLDPATLERNRAGVASLLERFMADGGADYIVADNAQWLSTVPLIEFLRDVGKLFSVNEMIRKDSVRSRLEGRDQGLSFTEFTYQLLQAWDFVQLHERFDCRLQLGGSDQWGNITEGVELVRRLRGAAAYGLTSPLVVKADGTKFGKTESGTVWMSPERTSPYEFFQFWIRVLDSDVGDYLRRFTFLDRPTIEAVEADHAEHPERRDAQRTLARQVTTMVHGAAEAASAERAAAVLFTEEVASLELATLRSALADAPTWVISGAQLEGGTDLEEVLIRTGLASSRTNARHHLASGAVRVNGRVVKDNRPLQPADALHGRFVLLRRGKKSYAVLDHRP
jgi:tyrosyl-tRNA synthetase